MRRRSLVLLEVAVAVLLAGLAAPSAAWAAPVSGPDYVAARNAAVAASGVFRQGTTIVTEVRDQITGAFIHMAVNPDGSLSWQELSQDGVFRLRCVRVGRCWEQSSVDFTDLRWHRITADSVTYHQAAAAWQDIVTQPWGADATFDAGTSATGTPLLTARGMIDGLALADRIQVLDRSVVYTLLAVDSVGIQTPLVELRMTSQDERIPVAPPPRRALGRPAPFLTEWIAEINS